MDTVRASITDELAQSYQAAADYQHKAEVSEQVIQHLQPKKTLKEALDEVKKEVNLLQHVYAMGYTMDKRKSTKKEVVMVKGDDRILWGCRILQDSIQL